MDLKEHEVCGYRDGSMTPECMSKEEHVKLLMKVFIGGCEAG